MYLTNLPSSEQAYDVCVVGAGPVGLTVALECEAAGLSVLLVEAGNARSQKRVSGLSEAEILDTSRHPSLEVVTRSGLGGTSAIWGGRCVPFDDVDFERRSFVAHSGWPVSHQELKPWYLKASHYLDCGEGGFVLPVAGWEAESGISFETVERLSSQPRLARRFKDRLKASRSLGLVLGRVASGLDVDNTGNLVRSLTFNGGASPHARLNARSFVLACGGLQTTRILLELQRNSPQRFGGDEGPLGRYYMGHLTGKIATVALHNPADVAHFDYALDQDHHWIRRRFSISQSAQIEQQLLNTVFWLGNPPFHDPGHASAAASCLYLGMRLPFIGRQWSSDDFFAFHGGRPSQTGRHIANVLRNPREAVMGITRAVGYHLSSNDLKPFFLRNDRGTYALHYHSEQIPSRSSRVRLVSDGAGGTRMSVDFRFCEDDARSVVRAHELLDKALRESGKGFLNYLQRPEERLHHVLEQARDGYHQIGSARMNESQNSGVVDRNCRVHGFDNLYLAGSAVFPTSGQANPTFFAVAIAARLAEHVRKSLAGPYSISA
jgi:choline dehydrogenase-like flavoprotein